MSHIMSKLLDRIYLAMARRLLEMARRTSGASLPGTIAIEGDEVTRLRPLGGYRQPGITKAGRLSFAGVYRGRNVKVYRGYSDAQNELRQNIQLLDFKSCGFPEILAVDKGLVVEAWVEGTAVSDLKGSDLVRAEAAIATFLEENITRLELQSIAVKHASAFCYFQNYLLPRLGELRYWSLVEDLVSAWKTRYLELKPSLGAYLTHPDLSSANIVRESATGRFIIIDNELIGVGAGWILDRYNSFLQSGPLVNVPNDFLELSWRLRLLGSAIDAGDLRKAQRLCGQ